MYIRNYIYDFRGKSRTQQEGYFHQQIELTFKEETSKMLKFQQHTDLRLCVVLKLGRFRK